MLVVVLGILGLILMLILIDFLACRVSDMQGTGTEGGTEHVFFCVLQVCGCMQVRWIGGLVARKVTKIAKQVICLS